MDADFQRDEDFEILASHAKRIANDVEKSADQIERDRAIPSRIIDDLLAHGHFRLLLPKSVGGHELDLVHFFAIVRTFASADASVGWCINQNNVFATNFAKCSTEAQREVWGNRRTVVTNGPPSASNRAEKIDGGYKLSGRWRFSSGIGHANWVAALSPVFNLGANEPYANLHFLVPVNEVEVDNEWDVAGLRGTGSYGFTADGLFVPTHRAFDANATPKYPNPYTATSTTPLFAMGFATVALAAASAAVIDAIATASRKVAFGNKKPMKHDPTVQRSLAEASAIVYSADSYLRLVSERVRQAASTLQPLSLDLRISVRLASTHAIHEAARATDIAYKLCGSDSIFASHPIQRRFQDVHAITQQIQGRLANYNTVGQHLLGIDPEGVF